MKIEERFLKVIKSSGLKQYDFAETIGTTQATISRYLSGKRKIDLQIALLLKYVHGINPNWLLTGEGDMFVQPEQKGNVGVSGGNVKFGDGKIINFGGNVTYHSSNKMKSLTEEQKKVLESITEDDIELLKLFKDDKNEMVKALKRILKNGIILLVSVLIW